MDDLNKEELTSFVNRIDDFDNSGHSQKILFFGYYLTNIINESFFDHKMIRQCYQSLDDYPPANISDFLRKLKKSKVVPTDSGFRLHRTETTKIKSLLNNTVQNSNNENKYTFSKNVPSSSELTQKHSLDDETILNGEFFDNTKSDKALALIKQFEILELQKFRVVGNYVRFDDGIRNNLKNLKQQIIEGLQPTAVGTENYLIWGPPGSGKSFFVQEIFNSLDDDVHYLELNLTKLTPEQFRTNLVKLEKMNKPCICLIDEIDSGFSGKWAYEILLTSLFPSPPRKFRVCFILAGSGGSNIDEMKKKIISNNKGTDLLGRISSSKEYVIPSLDVGDNLVVASSQLIKTATEFKPDINSIEKLGLFYIAVNPQFNSARQISELITSSIGRIPKGEDRIKYDHLFEPGNLINKDFYQRTKLLDDSLSNSFILVENN